MLRVSTGKVQVKPEVWAGWAKFTSFTDLAPQHSPKISAKTAQIWFECGARIRWVLALLIAA